MLFIHKKTTICSIAHRARRMKTDTNELQVYVIPDDRNDLSEIQIQEIVFSVLRRARIKPIPYDFTLANGEIYLEVNVSGIFNLTSASAFCVQVHFGVYIEKFKWVETRCSWYMYGTGKTDDIIDLIEEGVESVLDDYLKVNFDL